MADLDRAYVALTKAAIHGLTVHDLCEVLREAASFDDFERAVDLLCMTAPDYRLTAAVSSALALLYPK